MISMEVRYLSQQLDRLLKENVGMIVEDDRDGIETVSERLLLIARRMEFQQTDVSKAAKRGFNS